MNAVTPVNIPVIWVTYAYDNAAASLCTKDRAMNLIARTMMARGRARGHHTIKNGQNPLTIIFYC